MNSPIACTLSSGAAVERIEEWRNAIAASVLSVQRPAPGMVRLRLVRDAERIGAVVDLACREKACCDFLQMTLEIDGGGATLVIAAPDDAKEVLEHLTGASSCCCD